MKKVQLNPVGWMSQLSQVEVSRLQDATNSELFAMFRNCCLAVLNSGVDEDNFEALFAPYENFEIKKILKTILLPIIEDGFLVQLLMY